MYERIISRRYGRWLIGFLVWSLVVLFYSTRSMAPGSHQPWLYYLKVSAGQWFVWALFVPGIIWIDRLLPVARDNLVRRLLLHIPLCLVTVILTLHANVAVNLLLTCKITNFPSCIRLLRNSLSGNFHTYVLIYWTIVAIYTAYDYHNRLKERRIRDVELERQVFESQLDTLRTQMHPHFLFNALNTISAHVERDPRTARRMIEQLGGLLRLSLEYYRDQEIPLEREMDFLERYLDLQKARFEERLRVSMKVDPDVLNALVPTFILQPLVENAIRHGIATRSEKGLVEVAAWRDDEWLRLRVRDDGPGLPASWDPLRSVGIGIGNTRERLRRLYGDGNQNFTIVGNPGAPGVRVDLGIRFRAAGVGA